MIQNYLYHLCKSLDELCKTYDNLIIMEDHNCEISEDAMNELCVYSLSNLMKDEPNPNHHNCIHLILTNKSASF